MTEEEFVLSIIAMVMGTGLLIAVITKFTDLVKTWLTRGDSHFSDEEFSRLAKAFMQHKKEMEHRVKNLETIASAGDTERKKKYPELEEPNTESTLSNQLERKRRVR